MSRFDPRKAVRTMAKALRYVPKAIYRSLRREMDDVFSEPRKFVVFILMVIAVIALSSFLSVFIFSIPFFIYLFAVWLAKAEGRLDRGPRRFTFGAVIMIGSLVLTPSVLGYIYYEVSMIEPATVPKDHLYNTGWQENKDLRSAEILYLGLARYETVGYEHESSGDADYPGVLLVITIKSIPLFPEDQAVDMADDRITGYRVDGLSIEIGTKEKASRTLHNGVRTTYIEYDAVVKSDIDDSTMSRFNTGAKIHARAEVWTCSENGVLVMAVGFAQYGWTFEQGSYSARLADLRNDYQDDIGTYTDLKNHIYYTEC